MAAALQRQQLDSFDETLQQNQEAKRGRGHNGRAYSSTEVGSFQLAGTGGLGWRDPGRQGGKAASSFLAKADEH